MLSFILEVHAYLKRFERFLWKWNTFRHYFDRLHTLVVLDLGHVGFRVPIFYSFWWYSRETRTEKWNNQFMMLGNCCFKYASLMKTSWSVCEHYVYQYTCVTFMTRFPYDFILHRKSVTKIWQKIIIVFCFIRYTHI